MTVLWIAALVLGCTRSLPAAPDTDTDTDPGMDTSLIADTDPPTAAVPSLSTVCRPGLAANTYVVEDCALVRIAASQDEDFLLTTPDVGDLNGDGVRDLAFSMSRWQTIVYFGPVDGDLTVDDADLVVANTGQAFAVADMNGDGQDDMIVGHDQVFLLPGPFTAGTQDTEDYTPIADVGGRVTGLQVRDFDKDGKPDLVLSAADQMVLLSDPLGLAPTETRYGACMGPMVTGLSDYDGDGVLDLLCRTEFAWTVHKGPFDGATHSVMPGSADFEIPATGTRGYYTFLLEDQTGDGVPDYLIEHASNLGSFQTFWRGGTPTGDLMVDAVRQNYGNGGGAVGDFDGNGVRDIALPLESHAFAISYGPFDVSDPLVAVTLTLRDSDGAETYAFDLDEDGADDLFLAYEWNNRVVIFPGGPP